MLAAGQRVGSYDIIDVLGCGGTSEVYLVRGSTPGDDRLKALKLLREELRHNEAWQARIYNEALNLQALDLPGVVRIHDYGDWDNRPFLVLEYLRGGSLADRTQRLPLAEVLSLGISLARTLVGLDEHGIVHRDIKPHNVLLTTQGEPKLSDFSHAKNERAKVDGTIIPHSTETGTFLGTRVYAAPEQLLNAKAVTGSADVYSLGVMLFELLTGSLPFSSSDLEQPERFTEEAPLLSSRLSSAPPLLTELLRHMLSKRHQARPSASDVLVALLRIQRAPISVSHGRIRRAVAALAVLGLALLPPSPLKHSLPSLARAYELFETSLDTETIVEAQRALDLASEILGESSSVSEKVRAKHGYKVADLARAQGHLQEAAQRYEDALMMWRRRATPQGMPDDHRSFAICANNLGDVLMHLGQLDRALTLYQEAWHHQEILLSNEFSGRPQFAYTQYRIALLYLERGAVAEAKKALQHAWDLLAGRDDHPDVLLYRARVAERLAALSEGSLAMAYGQQAYDIAREAWRQHPKSNRHRLAYLRAAEFRGQQRGDQGQQDEALVGKRVLWRQDPQHGLWAHELLESLVRSLRQNPGQQDIVRDAHEVLRAIDGHRQWVDDQHVQAWRQEVSALEAQADTTPRH